MLSTFNLQDALHGQENAFIYLFLAMPTLGLDWIEEGELVLVEALKGAVPQRRDRQGL